MEFQDARNLVDKLVFDKSNRYLSDPEVEVLRGAWEGITYAQMARESQYSENYLMRDVGPNLFRLLKDALEEDVSKANFRAALERRQAALGLGGLGLHGASNQDWGEAPDISVFYGREEESERLRQWVVDDECRLVALSGLGGSGKTTLVRKLADEIQDEFDYVVWRSMETIPQVQSLIESWFEFFPDLNLTPEDSLRDVHTNTSLLIHYLNQHRCLLILDNVEEVLRGEDSHDLEEQRLAEDLKVFLKRIGSTNHKSCLLLISREKVRPVIELEHPGLVTSLNLGGLKREDARSLLEDKKLKGKEQWDTLIGMAKGIPLALKLIAADIKDLFDGNVAEFLKHPSTWIFDEEFAQILGEQYKALDPLERRIVHDFAEEEGPIALDSLTNRLSDTPTSSIMKSLITLIQKNWVEKLNTKEGKSSATKYQAPFLIRKYVKRYEQEEEAQSLEVQEAVSA